jgi:hypothetical protein
VASRLPNPRSPEAVQKVQTEAELDGEDVYINYGAIEYLKLQREPENQHYLPAKRLILPSKKLQNMDVGALSLNVTATGVHTIVPDNDIARIMYYLNCVTVGVGIDILEDDLVDYKNYYRLSRNRAILVLKAALALSPAELINQIIFRDDNGEVTGSSSNEFCDINVACSYVSLQREAIIGGRVQSISKVMFFKSQWLERYYNGPIVRLTRPTRQPTRQQSGCVIA